MALSNLVRFSAIRQKFRNSLVRFGLFFVVKRVVVKTTLVGFSASIELQCFNVLGVIMFKRGLGFLAGLALLSSGLIASELAVQGSSTTGGDAGTIRGRIGGEVRFSVTGAFNDSATVSFQGGSFRLTVRELWNLPANHPTIQLVDRVQLPDGQSRVLLRVRNGDRRFNGGSVALRRGTVLLDSDPIVLH
jgi:hypothetical protein